jgi:hypothetical protein
LPTPELVVRYFAKADITPEQSWKLLAWCAAHGADEFTIDGITVGRTEGPKSTAFFASLQPYARAEAQRRHLSGRTADDLVRRTSLWTLSSQTIALLRVAMPGGIFDYKAGGDPWLEDIALYRNREYMAGVITHERGGVIRATPQEVAELDQIPFPHKDQVPWVGY